MSNGIADPRPDLRAAYDRKADERDHAALQDWKAAERQNFLALLRQEGRQTLLELGAGPGHDSLFFQQQGLDVTAVDLSPAMVALCRAKGLRAEVMDMARLGFAAGSFAAVYAFNSLLHLPKAELPGVLREIARVLDPGGLFFMGVYGGLDQEGVWANDTYEPQRFFAFYTDDDLQRVVAAVFDIVAFHVVAVNGHDDGLHFQSLTLRRRAAP